MCFFIFTIDDLFEQFLITSQNYSFNNFLDSTNSVVLLHRFAIFIITVFITIIL